MLGKRELAELDDKESVIDYCQRAAHSKYSVHCPHSPCLSLKFYFLKNIIQFVRNVVCGLRFTAQHSVSSLKCSVQCAVKSPNFCRSAERGKIAGDWSPKAGNGNIKLFSTGSQPLHWIGGTLLSM